MQEYTVEQKQDIEERTIKALAYLRELNLECQAQVTKGKIQMEGNEFFVDIVRPYLLDTKFSNLKIPAEMVQDGAIPSNDPTVNPSI